MYIRRYITLSLRARWLNSCETDCPYRMNDDRGEEKGGVGMVCRYRSTDDGRRRRRPRRTTGSNGAENRTVLLLFEVRSILWFEFAESLVCGMRFIAEVID